MSSRHSLHVTARPGNARASHRAQVATAGVARLAIPRQGLRLEQLLDATDAVAEIQNTLRTGVAVTREAWRDA